MMVATRLNSPKSRHLLPKNAENLICYLRFAISKELQESSSSSCLTRDPIHPVNGSWFGIPRERKNRSQANEMLWIVTFGFGLARLRNVLVLLKDRFNQLG
jgi:hypothetical protein